MSDSVAPDELAEGSKPHRCWTNPACTYRHRFPACWSDSASELLESRLLHPTCMLCILSCSSRTFSNSVSSDPSTEMPGTTSLMASKRTGPGLARAALSHPASCAAAEDA